MVNFVAPRRALSDSGHRLETGHLTNIRLEEGGTYKADGVLLDDVLGDKDEEVGLVRELVGALENSPALGTGYPAERPQPTRQRRQPRTTSPIPWRLIFRSPSTRKEDILAESNVSARSQEDDRHHRPAKEITRATRKLNDTVRERAEKSQKEYFLREKMKAIKDELGEGDNSEEDEDSIKQKLEKNPYPENVKAKVKAELRRYEMMPEASLESSLIMNYIDVLLGVPWFQKTEDNDDLDNVQKILDEDHYGLDKVKKRIIEYLAVKHSTGNLKSPDPLFLRPSGMRQDFFREVDRPRPRAEVLQSLARRHL
jgi:ATP-dependent Lon protease